MSNSQIMGSFKAMPILDRLFSDYFDAIDPQLMRKWKPPAFAE